jgi:hypothetical protein
MRLSLLPFSSEACSGALDFDVVPEPSACFSWQGTKRFGPLPRPEQGALLVQGPLHLRFPRFLPPEPFAIQLFARRVAAKQRVHDGFFLRLGTNRSGDRHARTLDRNAIL